jgi:hypothetical protein
MRISETCIKRPVFATVLSLVMTLLGIVAYERLAIREYPNIETAVVTVNTTYRGADAQIVESQVTKVLEDSLAGIEGIDFMTSITRPESSQISITFVLGREPDGAAADVRDRVGRVRGKLPDEIDEPVIQKVEADAQAIMYLAFTSDRHSPAEITDYADRYVKDSLQVLPGVAEARIFGERRYSMRIWLNPDRLAAYSLTPQDVIDALRRQNSTTWWSSGSTTFWSGSPISDTRGSARRTSAGRCATAAIRRSRSASSSRPRRTRSTSRRRCTRPSGKSAPTCRKGCRSAWRTTRPSTSTNRSTTSTGRSWRRSSSSC